MVEVLRSPFIDTGPVRSPAMSAPVTGAEGPHGSAPPAIAVLQNRTDRPFWSVMIPVYNCPENYLRGTLESVLAQDPGAAEMQIEVLDNCSTEGNTEAIVREVGAGRVAYHRQTSNVGMVENFNDCIRRAQGHWVHILHGDDTVRTSFYSHLRQGIEANPDVGAALCRTIYMDTDGQWMGIGELEARQSGVLDESFALKQLLEQRIQFVSIVVSRSTYEQLGGFRTTLSHCIDWDMWKRIAVRKSVFYDPEPLACYRLHAGAASSGLMRSGKNVADERRSIAISYEDLPRPLANGLSRAAKRAAGVRAARRARTLWKEGERAAAWRQAAEAVRCSLAPAVVARSIYFVLRTVIR